MQGIVTFLLASVWLINGLGAKVLGLVPRHRLVVARFFGEAHSLLITRLIGTAEVMMSIWILSGKDRRHCALAQILVVVFMNALELWRARDLLLFPRLMPVANAALLGGAIWWSRGG